MRQLHRFFIFALLSTLLTSTYAGTFYRHIPFELAINDTDKVIVDYNFTGHYGIRCTADADTEFSIHFVYKGHLKSAALPIILQNATVPDKSTLELADVAGQFNVSSSDTTPVESGVYLSCDYVERDLL